MVGLANSWLISPSRSDPRVANRRQKNNVTSGSPASREFEFHIVSGIVELGFRG
jgi:hypothetical protein